MTEGQAFDDRRAFLLVLDDLLFGLDEFGCCQGAARPLRERFLLVLDDFLREAVNDVEQSHLASGVLRQVEDPVGVEPDLGVPQVQNVAHLHDGHGVVKSRLVLSLPRDAHCGFCTRYGENTFEWQAENRRNWFLKSEARKIESHGVAIVGNRCRLCSLLPAACGIVSTRGR